MSIGNIPELLHPSKHGALTNAGLMLDQRRRRWSNIKPTLGLCLVFAGIHSEHITKHTLN